MKLKIYNINDRYAFSVGGFSSLHHSFLIPSIQSTYSYAWQAYRTAKDMWKNKGSHVEAMRNKKYAAEDLTKTEVIDVAADDMLYNHYLEVFNTIKERAKGEKEKDKRELIYEEIKGVVTDLLKVKEGIKTNDTIENKKQYDEKINSVISKFKGLVKGSFHDLLMKDVDAKAKEETAAENAPPPAPPVAPQQPPPQADPSMPAMPPVTASIDKQMMEEYGAIICHAIEKKHPSAIYRVGKNGIDIVDAERNVPLLKVSVDKNSRVKGIVSLGEISDIYPSHSIHFYQRYWKPIVEGIGHFCMDNQTFLMASRATLPDIPKNIPSSFNLKGWDNEGRKEIKIAMSFVGKDIKDNATWFLARSNSIKKADTEYTEEDFIDRVSRKPPCFSVWGLRSSQKTA